MELFREIWVKNGNAISLCYAGTGALKADVTLTGKRTTAGFSGAVSSITISSPSTTRSTSNQNSGLNAIVIGAPL